MFIPLNSTPTYLFLNACIYRVTRCIRMKNFWYVYGTSGLVTKTSMCPALFVTGICPVKKKNKNIARLIVANKLTCSLTYGVRNRFSHSDTFSKENFKVLSTRILGSSFRRDTKNALPPRISLARNSEIFKFDQSK